MSELRLYLHIIFVFTEAHSVTGSVGRSVSQSVSQLVDKMHRQFVIIEHVIVS